MDTAASFVLVTRPEAWRREVCSCTTCDSVTCFAIRYHSELGCACSTCNHSKTCLFYQKLQAHLKPGEKPEPKPGMILSDLASKVKKSEEEVKEHSNSDKPNDTSRNICFCKNFRKDEVSKAGEIQPVKEISSVQTDTTLPTTRSCKNCKCPPRVSKDSIPKYTTEVSSEISSGQNNNTMIEGNPNESTIKEKETSESNFPSKASEGNVSETATKVFYEISSGNETALSNLCGIKVKDTSKCKNCKCPSKSSKDDVSKHSAKALAEIPPQQNETIILNNFNDHITVKDTSKCKNCKCPSKASKDSMKKSPIEAVVDTLSEPHDKIEDTKKYKECMKCKSKHSNNNIISTAFETGEEASAVKGKKCNQCALKSHKDGDINAGKVESNPMKDENKCPKTQCIPAYACISNNVGTHERKKKCKDCKCKSYYACSNNASLPSTITEKEQSKYPKQLKKCKKCQSVISRDSAINCCKSEKETPIQKDFKKCKSCTCKSAYACFLNTNDAKKRHDCKCQSSHASLNKTKLKFCEAKCSKRSLQKEQIVLKESSTVVNPSRHCCRNKCLIKDYNICSKSSHDRIYEYKINTIARHCNTGKSNYFQRHNIMPTEIIVCHEPAVQQKDSEKSLTSNSSYQTITKTSTEPEQTTTTTSNILEKVRKFLIEKLGGDAPETVKVNKSECCSKTLNSNDCKPRKPNRLVNSEHKVSYCKDSKESLPKASSVALSTEPSIIEIVRRYIAEKLSAQSTSTEQATEDQQELNADSVGPFVNRILITTTTCKKVGKNQLDDNLKDSVGNEVVYEFVRNKNVNMPGKRQNMCVQHASVPTSYTDDTSAELSALVMNVPYNDYKNTIKRGVTPKESTCDIFKKIKDIYNSCSCKVCECISTAVPTIKSDTCNCKPCECDQCRSLSHKKFIHNPCGCKPCECIECKLLRMNKQRDFIVAPVGESSHRQCQCSPCGCFECTNPFGQLGRGPATREMGTEVHRHLNCHCETCSNEQCEQEGADTCNCGRHSKVMRKPVQKDTNDYDLRHCTVHKADKRQRCAGHGPSKSNTFAMFATVSNSIIHNDNANSNHYKFACKGLSANAMQLSQELTSLTIPQNTSEKCDCTPCECLKCRKHFLEGHNPKVHRKDCWCEICECINCEISNSNNETNQIQDVCGCKPCECFDCKKGNVKLNYVEEYDGRQSHDDIDDSPHQSTKYNVESDHYLPLIKASDSGRFLEVFLKEKEKKNQSVAKKSPKFNRKNDPENLQLFCAITPRIKYNTSQSLDVELPVIKNDNKALDEVAVTDESSDVSTSGTLALKKHENTKSKESSCNSSGHDNSDYLIRFPRSTVETCIKDVMNLNIYRKVELANYLKSSLKNSASSTVSGNYKNGNRISFKGRQSYENAGILKNDTRRDVEMYTKINSDDQCDYEICDCEDCSYKTVKARKCRCNCAECACCETCLSKDEFAYIRKNEMTQTNTFLVDRGEYTWDINRSFTVAKPPNKYFHSSWNTEEMEVSQDTDNIVLRKCNVAFSDDTYTKNSVMNSRLNATTNILNYSNVQKTLQDAKAFSQELLRILGKYEKANKEFDSMSKKFEVLHSSLFTQGNINMKNTIIEEKLSRSFSKGLNLLPKHDEVFYEPKEINEYNRAGFKLTVPHAETGTEFDVNLTETALTSHSFTEIKKASNEAESMRTEPHTDSIGFESNGTTLVPSPNSRIKRNTKHGTKSLLTEPFCDMSTESDYDDPISISDIDDIERHSMRPLLHQQNILTEPHAEMSTDTRDSNFSSADNKLIEILSQSDGEFPDKPVVERISLKSSIVLLDKNSNKQDHDQTVKEIPKTSVVVEKEVPITQNIITDIDVSGEKLAHKHEVLQNVDRTKINNETVLKLADLKNKYKMYSQLINRGITKCRREIWNKMGKNESIALTESQITLSKMNIGLRKEIKDDDESQMINKVSIKQNDHELKPVFISSAAAMDEVLFLRNENANQNNIWSKKEQYAKSDKDTLEKINLSKKKKKTLDESKRNEGHKINASKGHYNIGNDIDSGASTSQDDNTKAQLQRNFTSVPVMASHKVCDADDRTDVTSGLASIFETKSISDPLKISFQAVRKVSDHTVIVKWKVPPVMTSVLGYELLIDGRSAQKVLSPSRNMAVVSCLPHSDKILLTVRTIMSKTNCGHYPSTSIVYRPQVK